MTTRDEQARLAGQALYGSLTQRPPNSQPANGIGVSEAIVQNGSWQQGTISSHQESVESALRKKPMSPLRRTFCLLITFDVIISACLWMLYSKIKSATSNSDEFRNEVVFFTFKKSLFDTVMLSLFRFVCLILPYGLFRSKYPWFVAATTFVTSVYMIVKIVLFTYEVDTALEILNYIILITQLVLSWVETWLLDLKVIPEEKRELEALVAANRSVTDDLNERAPLLSRFLRPTRTEESYYSPNPSQGGDSGEESDDNRSFHSAHTSRSHSRTQSITSSTSQGAYYKSLIMSAQRQSLDLMDSEGWSREAGVDEVEGIVYARHTRDYGKVFKLVGEVEVDALTFYTEIVENASNMPKWNPTVLEVKTLEVVDDNTEVSYNVAAEGARGLVSSRDFVCVRHWEQLDGWYITSSTGAEHSSMPPQARYVRGEQGPGIMRLKDVSANRMRVEWLLNSNLKGWLPQYLIDQALSGVMMDYLENLKKHASTFMSASAVQS